MNVTILQKNESYMDVSDIWESSFKMKFSDYRNQMSAISRESLESTGCQIINDVEELLSREGEEIIIPVNSDDWLSPNISNVKSQ